MAKTRTILEKITTEVSMSSKSAAHSPVQGHTLFSRKMIIIAAVAIGIVFLITVSYYPLIFSSESSPTNQQPTAPINK